MHKGARVREGEGGRPSTHAHTHARALSLLRTRPLSCARLCKPRRPSPACPPLSHTRENTQCVNPANPPLPALRSQAPEAVALRRARLSIVRTHNELAKVELRDKAYEQAEVQYKAALAKCAQIFGELSPEAGERSGGAWGVEEEEEEDRTFKRGSVQALHDCISHSACPFLPVSTRARARTHTHTHTHACTPSHPSLPPLWKPLLQAPRCTLWPTCTA
jgi:hypothetical protein